MSKKVRVDTKSDPVMDLLKSLAEKLSMKLIPLNGKDQKKLVVEEKLEEIEGLKRITIKELNRMLEDSKSRHDELESSVKKLQINTKILLEKTDNLFAKKFSKMGYQPINERIQVYSPELIALKDEIKMIEEAILEKSGEDFFEEVKKAGASSVKYKEGILEIKI